MTPLHDWELVVAAALLGAAWVTVEWMKRRCWHVWETVATNAVHAPLNAYQLYLEKYYKVEREDIPTAYIHQQRCKGCGAMRTFRVSP